MIRNTQHVLPSQYCHSRYGLERDSPILTMMCYCNTPNFNFRILCVPYRILWKTHSLVSMKLYSSLKCHCTATVDNVHGETWQVLTSTLKLFISIWEPNFVPALYDTRSRKSVSQFVISQSLYLPYMTPTQGSQSTTNWSQFVISQTFLIVLHVSVSGFPDPSDQHIYMYIFSTSPLFV